MRFSSGNKFNRLKSNQHRGVRKKKSKQKHREEGEKEREREQRKSANRK